MHDLLYLRRSQWVPAEEVRAFFNTFASELGLDLARFTKDMDGEEVARRIAADQDRGASLGIDRTPVVFINGKKVELLPSPRMACARRLMRCLAPEDVRPWQQEDIGCHCVRCANPIPFQSSWCFSR